MIETKKNGKEKNKYFEALEVLNLNPSQSGESLLEILAEERVKMVEWEGLTTSDSNFDLYFKQNLEFWEDMFEVSKCSLKRKGPGFVVLKVNESNKIVPIEIIDLKKDFLTKNVEEVIIEVAKIIWNESEWKVLWTFTDKSDKVSHSLESLGDLDSPSQDEIDQLLKERKLFYEGSYNKNKIPVIEWKSLPKNIVFYESILQESKLLSRVNDMFIDQLINGLQKRQIIETSMSSGTLAIENIEQMKKTIFEPINYVNSSTIDEYDKSQAIYQPKSEIVKEYRDTIIWLEELICQKGQSFKTMKENSTEKNKNLNFLLNSSLALNLEMWIKSIKQLVGIYSDLDNISDLEINLKLRKTE